MALVLEQVGGVVAQVAGLDVLGRNARIDGFLHVLESLDEQVAAGLVGVGPELGQTGADNGHRASQTSGNGW